MIFQPAPLSPDRQLQDELIPGILFVAAQAARTNSPLSFNQIDDALVSYMMPETPIERGRLRRQVFDILSKKVLVARGFASYSKGRGKNSPEVMNITQRGMALIGSRCAALITAPNLNEEVSATEGASRISEKDILVPALATIIKAYEETGLPVEMGTLREGVKRMLNISSEDLDPLDGRKDTKIDQVIRNLRSHNTLLKNGWVEATESGYVPTDRGYAQIAEVYLSILPSPDFSVDNPSGTLDVGGTSAVESKVVRPRMRHR